MERKPGDIIVMEPGNDWIGKGIAKLTHSNVSHSAMLKSETTMVEMGGRGISVDSLIVGKNGDMSYFLRMNPEKDPAPLMQASEVYEKAGAKFDYADLLMLGGLLVYRSVRPTPHWQKATDMILELLCYELDRLLNRLLHKKTPVMLCSQLVYQCYYDCGADYRIILDHPFVRKGEEPDKSIRLADYIPDRIKRASSPAAPRNPGGSSSAQLAKDVYHALCEADQAEDDLLLEGADLHSTAQWAGLLLDLLEKLLEQTGMDLPVPALFVAPCDLLHAANLIQYDYAPVERIRRH